MLHLFAKLFSLSAAMLAALAVQSLPAFAQDNPYRLEKGWAKYPAGRKWGSTSGVDVDRDGNTKGRYENVGVVFEDRDGKPVIAIKRTFNPAGVSVADGKAMVEAARRSGRMLSIQLGSLFSMVPFPPELLSWLLLAPLLIVLADDLRKHWLRRRIAAGAPG